MTERCYNCDRVLDFPQYLQGDNGEEYPLCDDCMEDITGDDRLIALFEYLNDSEDVTPYDIDTKDEKTHEYGVGNRRWRVLTDDEAYEAAREAAMDHAESFIVGGLPSEAQDYFDYEKYADDTADISDLDVDHNENYWQCQETGTDWYIARAQ